MIDCNASLGNWPFRHLAHSDPDGLLAWMDENGIAQAWVSPLEALLYRSLFEANESLRGKLAGHEDRLLLVPAINPAYPGWDDDLAEYLAWDVFALRLLPNYHGYDLLSGDLAALLEVAQRSRLVVQIAVRMQDERLHHPLVRVAPVDLKPLEMLAADHPSVRFMVLNASRSEARAIDNVWWEISHTEGIGGVGKLADVVGVGNVTLGSHVPLLYMKSAVLKLQEADLPEADLARIRAGNARELMG